MLHDGFKAKLADVVAEASNWPADLIVIGTHGRRDVAWLILGSGAENVLRMAPVPVLLVRATEKATADEAPQAVAHLTLPSAALAME
jgi:hypothetical protein